MEPSEDFYYIENDVNILIFLIGWKNTDSEWDWELFQFFFSSRLCSEKKTGKMFDLNEKKCA